MQKKNKEDPSERISKQVMIDIHQTLEEVSEELLKKVQYEQVLRREIRENNDTQIHHIQENKNALEMYLDNVQEKRLHDISQNEDELERALTSGNIEAIKDILKHTLE